MTIQYGSRDISKVGNTVYFKFTNFGFTKDTSISIPFRDIFGGCDCKALGGVAEGTYSWKCPDGTNAVKRCTVEDGLGFYKVEFGITNPTALRLDRAKSSLTWSLVDRSGRSCPPNEPSKAYKNFSANIDKNGQITVNCSGLRWTQNCTSSLKSSYYTNNIVVPFKSQISSIQNELLNVIDSLQDPDVDINTANDIVVSGIKKYKEVSNLKLEYASKAANYASSGSGGKCYEMQHVINGTIAFTLNHTTEPQPSEVMGSSTQYPCLDAEGQGLLDSALRVLDTNYLKVKETYDKVFSTSVPEIFKTKFGIVTTIKSFEASDLMCPVEYILKDLQCVKEYAPDTTQYEDGDSGEIIVDGDIYNPISPDIVTGNVVSTPTSVGSKALLFGGLALAGIAGYYMLKK